MKILIIKCLNDNYSYIIFNPKTLLAAVIDPSEANPIINEIEKNNLKLKYILNTHHHYDHVGGNSRLMLGVAMGYNLPIKVISWKKEIQ